ncbi:MAG: isochorismatase family protein [Planctomycetes bacterium]|nr:isochorismatase family protein [Planctomycetota bacterium]
MKRRRRWVLIDINTQRDFFAADGRACVENSVLTLNNLRRVMAWVRRKDVSVISISDVQPDDANEQSGCCIEGTSGQRKIHYTLRSNRAGFPADRNTDLPAEILRQYKQIILQSRCTDPFDEPRIDRLLSEVRANEFIIIGATAEGSVEAVVLGLLQRGKNVTVITDAVGSHSKRQQKLAFGKMKAKGAKLVETKKLAGQSKLKSARSCKKQKELVKVKAGC